MGDIINKMKITRENGSNLKRIFENEIPWDFMFDLKFLGFLSITRSFTFQVVKVE